MFVLNSKSKTGLLKASTLLLSLMSFQSPCAFAADSTVELKPQSPQIDTAPPADAATGSTSLGTALDTAASSTSSGTAKETAAATTPRLHKLEAVKRSMRAESDTNADNDLNISGIPGFDAMSNHGANIQTTIQIDQGGAPQTTIRIGQGVGPQSMRQIVINSYVMRANLPSTAISDPFTLMRALLGSNEQSREYEKLYAQRDTGYGVCGFLMNMPVMQRGYAVVLKCFPSMPAAEANLIPGDEITSVNGQSTLDLPPKEVWNWFTGMPGTEVKIEILRGKQPISVTLKRMDIGRIPDFATRAEFLTLYRHNGMSKFVQK